MIDYAFYTNTYLGSVIPEKAFSGVAARAQDELNRICRCCQVIKPDAVSEKMALCAMAETIYTAQNRKNGIAAATVGGVSVRYESSSHLWRSLLERAGIYLDIYRGAGV